MAEFDTCVIETRPVIGEDGTNFGDYPYCVTHECGPMLGECFYDDCPHCEQMRGYYPKWVRKRNADTIQ